MTNLKIIDMEELDKRLSLLLEHDSKIHIDTMIKVEKEIHHSIKGVYLKK